MDDLEFHEEVVFQTLRELDFINQWLGGNAVTLDAMERIWEGGFRMISLYLLPILRKLWKWGDASLNSQKGFL